MVDECPICFEPLSNVSTRVITECCNNMMHLGCLVACDKTCPLCRGDVVIPIMFIPTPPPPATQETTPLIIHTSNRRVLILKRLITCIFLTMSLATLIPMMTMSDDFCIIDFTPPAMPPPPYIPP